MKGLQEFLSLYEQNYPDLVVHVEQEVDARFEASAIALKAQKELREPPVFIFHRVRTTAGEISQFPVVLNLFASRRRLAFAIGSSFQHVGRDLFEKRSQHIKPTAVSRTEAPVKQVVKRGTDVNLQEIPGLVHAAWDPGPYVSAGYLTTYDPDTGIDNCALQRGWFFDRRELRIFPNRASHNRWNINKCEKRGEDARVAIWTGHHPAVCMGAEAKMGYPLSHWDTAGGCLGEPLRLVASETLGDDFLVPADAEFVIEGIVPKGKLKPEGPFGEYTRYFGAQRLNPYMETTCISHRRNAHWTSIITGYADDMIGALRREGLVYDGVKRVVPQILAVYRPMAAPHHMYIQINKTHDAQPRAAIMAALSLPDAIKHVFVFDQDVDIFDEDEVQWAIDTRSDWAKDLIVVPNLEASHLEPTTTGDGLGTRAGIDCTIPSPPAVYEQRSFIPQDVMDRIKLEDYLPKGKGRYR
ncbi:MAG TPA: UbiD family decarboxylase [Candidatus Binatia bacterium]